MKTILITGANRGLGLEMVRQYVAAGWQVLACCRSGTHAKELVELSNERLHIFKLDVTSEEDIRALSSQLSHQPIDILINNAGILKTYDPASPVIDRQAWMETLRVNTIAPAMIATAFAAQISRSQHKLIANISSSLGGISTISDCCYLYYGSSKAALNYVTKSLALSFATQGISIISIHPGWVKTDMGSEKAPLHPEQSIEGIRTLLEGIRLEHSGNFYDYEGNILAY